MGKFSSWLANLWRLKVYLRIGREEYENVIEIEDHFHIKHSNCLHKMDAICLF